jgi:hypothetical protein
MRALFSARRFVQLITFITMTTFNHLKKALYLSLLAVGATLSACSTDQTGPNASNSTGDTQELQAIDTHGSLAFNADERLAIAADDLSKANGILSAQQNDPILQARVAHTKEVQERHTADLLKKEGVIGTGVWLNGDGTTSLAVFARHGNLKDLPASLEDQKTHVEVIGDVKAMSGVYTGYYRPVPAGVSIGNENEIAAGTLGCAVNINGYAYMLSNNHVLARQNAAKIGEAIGQPGRIDYANYGYSPQAAVLSAFKPISFTSSNTIDAAIARYTTNGYASMVNNLYVPMHTTMTPTVGMYVKKVGRTTGFTHGQIGAVNVTVQVSYNQGTATFTNQIYVTGTSFLQAGDSGSLLVTESGNYPVGLCFAGSDNAAFANPIQPVLQYFGATVIGY